MATIMRKMNIISRCEGIYRTKRLSEDLQATYHSYILAICHNPGMSQEEIAKHLCINKSTTARHIAFLEKNGYIKREVCAQDKREMLVYPSKKMLEILPEVVNITKEWNSLVSDGLTEEELEFFHRILEKMVKKSTEIIYPGEKE